MSINPNENPHLESLQRKLVALRDDVRSVVRGYKLGLLLYGAPGIGKSWTIRDELEKLQVAYRELGIITPRALFEHLQRFPHDFLLIEDNESLLADSRTASILRTALGVSDRDPNTGRYHPRHLEWDTARGSEEAMFDGGVIMVQNGRPSQSPQSLAIQSRIITRHLSVSSDELAALMRHLAATNPPTIMGYRMTSEECSEVAAFLIRESLRSRQVLNMRLLEHAYEYYVQDQHDGSDQHWQDRVVAQLTGCFAQTPRHNVDMSGRTQREKHERLLGVVRQILADEQDPTERVAVSYTHLTLPTNREV